MESRNDNVERTEVQLKVPYDRESLLGEIRRSAVVEEEHYEKDAVVLVLRAEPDSIERLRRLLAA